MPLHSRPAARTTASRACARIIAPATTPPSSSIPTAIASRPIAGSDERPAMTIDLLDNPIWHALGGPHCRHALGRGLARHYPRDIAPFSAIAEASAAAYADLAD